MAPTADTEPGRRRDPEVRIGPTEDDLTEPSAVPPGGRWVCGKEMQVSREPGGKRRAMPERPAPGSLSGRFRGTVGTPRVRAPGERLRTKELDLGIPGVLEEDDGTADDDLLPRLRRVVGGPSVVKSRLLRSWGMSESQVSELLDDLFQASVNPSVAFLASSGEIKVRITAKADTEAEATRV